MDHIQIVLFHTERIFDETNCVFYNSKISVVSLVSDRLLGGHDGKCVLLRASLRHVGTFLLQCNNKCKLLLQLYVIVN